MAKTPDTFFARLVGRAPSRDKPSVLEVVFTIAWLTLLLLVALIFWPEAGSFIYEGF